ncbi:extracellular solute-binding protein [Bacillus sinesaloumensis]|uniref:extracellular solute-binding protein n=1 Tax=Litchfieldia sinesaloumensis TaxID=1926280 RepID=UPI001F26B0FD|nr:extracellular solute-binding protein [Bacillus sinesaloumensis]
MKLKKRRNMLLTSILAATLFITGCSSGETSNSENKENKGNNESQEKTEISISLRTLALPYIENSPNINEDELVKKLEELTNTDLDIRLMDHNDYRTKMDLMFASGNIPDVVQGMNNYYSSGQSLEQAVEAGVFMPLDELIEEHGPNLKKFIPEEVWETHRYKDGKIYAIPQILSNPARRATFIRKDLLDKAGLEIPKTAEETLEVLRAFKEMGVEQPYVARKGLSYSDTFFGSFDVQPVFELNESGDPVPKYLDVENMTKALDFYKTMYDEGLIDREFLTQESSQYKDIIQSGKGGMWSANANVLNSWEQILQKSVPDADIAIIPSPVGPDGKGGYVLYSNTLRTFLINSEAKNPEKIIQFFDWMVSEEAEEFFTYGIEGTDYTKEAGKINYNDPESQDGVNREAFRTGWLWLIGDATYTKGLLELTPEGKELLSIYDDILMKEGRGRIVFEPPLQTLTNQPALQDNNIDGPNDFMMEHIAKMITGAEPISNWEKVLEEWKSKGGEKLLEDAKAQYEQGLYQEAKDR